jgi:predicted Zn-dependent peptidase
MLTGLTARKRWLLFLLLLTAFCGQAQLKINVSGFQLNNGLKVVLNRDTSFNEVALYLFADAGFSKEAAGQHGMAHLFEHVMLPTRFFHNPELSRNAGQHSINSNAQVFNDFVRYYLHYDKNGLDYGLISLADRLDFQIDSLTDDQLQRHINNVASEISRSESFGSFRWRPVFRDALAKGLFGSLHPYGHEQSLTDISRATKKDVQSWFRSCYGAGNATLMVLGNAHPDSLRAKVETIFGNIEPGKQSMQQEVSLPVFKEARKVSISFNQDNHVVYYAWAIPGYATKEDDYFRLLSQMMADPANGILTKALKALGIQNAKAFSETESNRYASVFDVGVEFTDAKDREKIEAIIREQVKKLAAVPLNEQQLQSAFNQYQLSFISNMEGIGLNDERISELGKGALFLDDPLYFETRLGRLKMLTPHQFRQAIAKWLANPPFIANISGRKLAAGNAAYDFKRSIPFIPPSEPSVKPIFQKKLADHLTVHAVKLSRIPVVNFLVAFENSSGLLTSEMIWYKDAINQFFESDPAFAGLQAKGLQTETKLSGKTIIYKASVTKDAAPQVFQWLQKRLHSFTGAEKSTKAVDPSSQMERTLSVLKRLALPEIAAADAYPLSHIHFIVVGDTEPQAFDWNSVAAPKAKFWQGMASPASEMNSANLWLKDIGESPTSFLTLGHFLKPADIKEEIYQRLLVHLLRAKLMANLREKNSLAYEVYPYSTTPAGDQILGFWQTSVAVEKTERALQEIANELEQLPSDLEKRVSSAKARVMAELKSKFQSLGSIENTIIETIEYDRSATYFADAIQVLNTLDATQFVKFVKENAKPEHFKLALFTTPKMVKRLMEKGEKVQVVK